MVELAETVWRDFVTDGIPSSGANDPRKRDIREWGTYVEAGILGASAGGVNFVSKASMDAELDYDQFTMAWVIGDATVANNGIYRKIGASGTGSWVRSGDLPYSFIKASDAGAGAADAIIATTSTPLPTADAAALIALNIFEDNTGSPVTVAFNGGTALTIKTNSGNDVAVGGLTAGMIVAGYVSGSTFRLLSDQASAAVLAQMEATLAEFQTIYLGAFTTANAPTVDLEGGALIVGAMYFDTDADEMKVWNGTAWVGADFTAGTFGADLLVTDTAAEAGDVMLPAILEILPKLTGDTIDLMLFTQAGVSPDRYNGTGSEALNNAAFADAIAEMVAQRALGAHVAIKIPWGVFRIDAPIEITQSVCHLAGQGSGATRIITGDATIDMVTFTGGLDLSPLSRVGLSGVSLARDGTTPVPNGRSTPKQLNLTNVQYGVFNDVLIDKAGIGVYGARLFDSMFNQLKITGANQSDRAGYAGIMMTAETGQGGACFGNHFTDFEIQYPGAGQDAAYTNGILVECADGLYLHHGHILQCTNGINFNPDGTASLRDKIGGVWVTDVYLDHNNDYGALLQGVGTNYGRLFFDRVRFSYTGLNAGIGTACRVSPTAGTTISDLEFGDCTFNESQTSGIYVVNPGSGTAVDYLKVSGCTFRNNNQSNVATAADIRLERGEDYFIEGNNIYGGGAAGTGILVASGAGAGTIENNDLQASTSGTKISIAGHDNGRKFVNNREAASGFAEYSREGAAQTTTATPLQVLSIAVEENWTVEVIFTATASQSTKGKAASFKRVAMYNRATAGSLTEEGTQALVWGVEDDAGTDISLLVSGTSILARVVGIAATTFNWQWKVEYKVRSA